jgi:hypothetical protein
MSIARQQELIKFLNSSLSGERYLQVRTAVIEDKELDLKYDFGRMMAGTYILSDNDINRIWQIIDETYERFAVLN